MELAELKKLYGIEYVGRLICPICGNHKTHYRLEGYRCHFAEHTYRERQFEERLIELVLAGQISQSEYDEYH